METKFTLFHCQWPNHYAIHTSKKLTIQSIFPNKISHNKLRLTPVNGNKTFRQRNTAWVRCEKVKLFISVQFSIRVLVWLIRKKKSDSIFHTQHKSFLFFFSYINIFPCTLNDGGVNHLRKKQLRKTGNKRQIHGFKCSSWFYCYNRSRSGTTPDRISTSQRH